MGRNLVDMYRFHRPTEELLPELMLLGELGEETECRSDGKEVRYTFMLYQGKKYIMNHTVVGRWFEDRGNYAPKSIVGLRENLYTEFEGGSFEI